MTVDMSKQAVTNRLRRVSQLRRLCLALAARPSAVVRETPAAYPTRRQSPTVGGGEGDENADPKAGKTNTTIEPQIAEWRTPGWHPPAGHESAENVDIS